MIILTALILVAWLINIALLYRNYKKREAIANLNVMVIILTTIDRVEATKYLIEEGFKRIKDKKNKAEKFKAIVESRLKDLRIDMEIVRDRFIDDKIKI